MPPCQVWEPIWVKCKLPSKTTHKLPRDDGCFSRSERLRETLGKQGCLCQNRQYNSYVLHKQTRGGVSIPKSLHFDLEYFQWAIKHKIVLIAQHVSGRNNCLADLQSRGSKIKEHGVDFEKVCGPNNFSDVGNSECRPISHSTESPDSNICIPISRRISPDSGCSVDQLEGCDRLCSAPHCSNSQGPAEIQEVGCKIILIAPFWTRQPWFPILTQLLVDYPVRLPEISNLISQPRSRLYHQNVSMSKLTAWRLSADSWLRKAVLDQCRNEQHRVGKQAPTVHTTIDSESF